MIGNIERANERHRRYPSAAALPGSRVIRLGSGGIAELAGSSTTDAIGTSMPGSHAADSVHAALRSAVPSSFIEASGEVTLGPVYLASDGKVASSGTVRWGVAITEATDDIVEIVPD